MSKQTNQPRVASNEARAYSKYLRTSPQKLNLVAGMIRGKAAEKALIDLSFSRRRIAIEVKKVLQTAVANAENNHNLDVDRLIVAEAHVGKTMVMKRFRARGRGRSAQIQKPFSNLTIIVREQAEEKKEAKKAPVKKEAKKETKKAPAKKTAAKTESKKD